MNKKIKILIIDDEEIVLNSCVRILKKENYSVDVASSSRDGLALIKNIDYDILVTDLKMPDINGMQVLETVVKEKPGITVVVFTGYATVESARQALKTGAYDYVPKPFKPDEFRSIIKNAVKSRGFDPDTGKQDIALLSSPEHRNSGSAARTIAEIMFKGYFGSLDKKYIKTVEKILWNTHYFEDILRNHIELSRMDFESMEIFKKEIDFAEDVIQPVIDMPEYSKNMKDMGIVFNYKIKPVIKADPILLQVAVSNLVSNAVKYGSEHTDIDISLEEENGDYVFSITNQGRGFNAQDEETVLFRKFGRIKGGDPGEVKGAGLGLYICRKIIEKHGSKISALSEPGKWARFFFRFPAEKQE